MKFTIALYGSFKDSAGYTWKLPNGYNKKLFEVIESNLSQKYEDGRKLGNNELYGGYFVDIHNDLFIAFRFIDGGHDALGRTGVVITNWAVTQYSKILGKNIKPLFDRLTIKQMPIDGSIDVDLPSEFTLSNNYTSNILGTERDIWGEETLSLFKIPSSKCSRITLTQFALKENYKKASIKFLSPIPKEKNTEKTTKSQRKIPKVNLTKILQYFPNIDFCNKFVLPILLIACCSLFFIYFFNDKKVDIPPVKDKKAPTKIEKQTNKIEKQTNKITSLKQTIANTWLIYMPSCVWVEKHNFGTKIISNIENHYRWGNFKIDENIIHISFAPNITLLKENNEYKIRLEDKTIGRIEIKDDNWLILFDRTDSSDTTKLFDEIYLINKKNRKECGILSIQPGEIVFEVIY